MNKLAFFKGRILGVEKQNINSDKSLHRIEVGVEEYVYNKEADKKLPVIINYFLKKWDWDSVDKYVVGNEYYFVNDIEYRKVESKKGKNEDGTPFIYGAFDFRCVAIFETKIELISKLNKSIE